MSQELRNMLSLGTLSTPGHRGELSNKDFEVKLH